MIESFKKGKNAPHKAHNSGKSKDCTLTPDCQAYASAYSLFCDCDLIIFVLDSRNPLASRHLHFENLYKSKCAFVLNKIDLVPREIAVAWMKALSEKAPTFAVSAVNNVEPIREYIVSKAHEANKQISVVLSGVANVGKNTISEKLGNLENIVVKCTHDWIWLQQTSDLVSIGAISDQSVVQKSLEFSRDFLNRCSIHSLMEAFSVPYLNDVDIIFSSISDNKKAASLELLNGLCNGKYLFYSMPPAKFTSELTDEIGQTQRDALQDSLPADLILNPLIHVGFGTQNKVKISVLKKIKKLK